MTGEGIVHKVIKILESCFNFPRDMWHVNMADFASTNRKAMKIIYEILSLNILYAPYCPCGLSHIGETIECEETWLMIKRRLKMAQQLTCKARILFYKMCLLIIKISRGVNWLIWFENVAQTRRVSVNDGLKWWTEKCVERENSIKSAPKQKECLDNNSLVSKAVVQHVVTYDILCCLYY